MNNASDGKPRLTIRRSWFESLQGLVDWLESNDGQCPRLRSTDEAEKKIAVWLRAQNILARSESRSDAFVARGCQRRMDEAVPGWNLTVDQKWVQSLESLVAWRNEHPGRWPARRYDDHPVTRLGKWLSDQRVAANGGKNAAYFVAVGRRQLMDDAVPGWLKPKAHLHP